ncbi:MAG: hypothetical protein U9N52_03980 [Campylobacterota bacterium]|nr:hypothetical protein [Campylobacterota bacterium]
MKNSKTALKFFALFIIAYALFLSIWLLIKDPYNRAVTELSFALSTWKYDLHVKESSMHGREMTFSVSNTTPMMGLKGIMKPFIIDISFDIESVTFNIPMTLSLLTALIITFGGSFREKMRLVAIGMGALFALHVITLIVISISLFAGTKGSSPMVHFYLNRFWMPLDLLETLGMILNAYAARFEPFLIAILVWWQLQTYEIAEKKEEQLPHF